MNIDVYIGMVYDLPDLCSLNPCRACWETDLPALKEKAGELMTYR